MAPQIPSLTNRFHSEAKLPWSYDYPIANPIATNNSSANREIPLFSRLYPSSAYLPKIFPPRGLKYSLFLVDLESMRDLLDSVQWHNAALIFRLSIPKCNEHYILLCIEEMMSSACRGQKGQEYCLFTQYCAKQCRQ